MPKLLNITADSSFAPIVERFLRDLGHVVLTTPIPLDGGALRAFEPDAGVVLLSRRVGAMGDRIDCPEVEISGFDVLRALSLPDGGLPGVPIILLGRGLTPRGIPPWARYAEFARFSPSLRHLESALKRVLQPQTSPPELVRGEPS